jgi:hypothetical protein
LEVAVGYLASFAEDGFISYAHGDDDAYATEEKGWIEILHHDLELRVGRYLGLKGEARLWRDCEIRNNEDFEEKISGRLANTATLLPVISPTFFQRSWCLRELEEFVSCAEQMFGLRIGEDRKKRILQIKKLPVDRTTLPESLQGTGSYTFYEEDPNRPKRVHEFRPQIEGKYTGPYWEALDELAQDIAEVLKAMAEREGGVTPGTAAPKAVYVAETTSDLDREARQIKRDLKARSYVVLPAGDLPYRAKQFREKVEESLKRSVLSVHLIGKEYGVIPEGETEKSNVWLQDDLAKERGADPDFVRLIWMPGNLKSSDPRQQRFIQYLREDSGAQKGADVLETGLEDLKTTLQEKLGEIQEKQERKARQKDIPKPRSGPAPTTSIRNPEEPLRIYVICDQLDEESCHLGELRKFLYEQGYESFLPVEADNEQDAIQRHAESLEICDACLIYYGEGSKKWFEAKLADFRKVLSRRQRPILVKGAVYLAPPSNDAKRNLLTREVIVLPGSESFSPPTLDPFIQKLRAATQGGSGP